MGITIYTDGACEPNPGSASWAWVAVKNNQVIDTNSGFLGHATNNIGELTAVLQALHYCESKGINDIKIKSDSKYVVDGITKWAINWKKKGWKKSKNKPLLNKELWEELDHITEKLNVKYEWVKGHNGNAYNEHADFLARQEIEQNGID